VFLQVILAGRLKTFRLQAVVACNLTEWRIDAGQQGVRFACAGSIESENEGSDYKVRRLRLTWMIDWFSFLFLFFCFSL
jgi:hypothetical protein